MKPAFRLWFITFLLLLFLTSCRLAAATPIQHTSNSTLISSDRSTFFEDLTQKWTNVIVTVSISIPWLVIGVFDAIDAKYRSAQKVAQRLLLASIFLLSAYTLGIFTIVGIIQQMSRSIATDDRYDEIATILVLLLFNLWHICRNIRGWSQFIAIQKTRTVFERVQKCFADTFPYRTEDQDDEQLILETSHGLCIQGLSRLRISNRLIDNEVRASTPFLNPFFRLSPIAHSEYSTKEEEAWAIAIWRAWWTQDTSQSGIPDPDLSAPSSFRCDKTNRYQGVEDLQRTLPSALGNGMEVRHQDTGKVIENSKEWAEALLTYGGPAENSSMGERPEGQQDTHGEALPSIASPFDASGIALMVKEKTRFLPHRMSALWYNTERFSEVYENRAFDNEIRSRSPQVMFPRWRGWIKIAKDLVEDGMTQISSPDRTIYLLAGELASASLILVRYPKRYKCLVDLIYEDGLNARWTFGWSGLLACFSHLWTKERIYIAMLNGLSLLALTLSSDVYDIDANVRSMLYGYAAFAVSDRAVGMRIAQDRKAELHRRYKQNKGKTCRGTGLHAIRLACQTLGLPAEASHMDGLPSFSTGWAGEYLERKPGNQSPEHGNNHDQVEAKQGSSNVFRYPGGCF